LDLHGRSQDLISFGRQKGNAAGPVDPWTAVAARGKRCCLTWGSLLAHLILHAKSAGIRSPPPPPYCGTSSRIERLLLDNSASPNSSHLVVPRDASPLHSTRHSGRGRIRLWSSPSLSLTRIHASNGPRAARSDQPTSESEAAARQEHVRRSFQTRNIDAHAVTTQTIRVAAADLDF
jgi:hypothetical protein